jgi:hypothetical protein
MDLAGLAVFPEGWVDETSGQGEAVPVHVWVPRSIAAQLRRTNLGLHGDVVGILLIPSLAACRAACLKEARGVYTGCAVDLLTSVEGMLAGALICIDPRR